MVVWGDVLIHVILHPRLPFFLVYVEKIEESGDEPSCDLH